MSDATGFAATTSVPSERTRAEIETTLKKYKADSFASGWNEREAFVAFHSDGRMIRFKIKLPDRGAAAFTHINSYTKRAAGAADKLYDQAVRTIWRRLLLCIRAKLESVASGIETFEAAFCGHIVIPGTEQTVAEWAGPQIAEAYEASRQGRTPRMIAPVKSVVEIKEVAGDRN